MRVDMTEAQKQAVIRRHDQNDSGYHRMDDMLDACMCAIGCDGAITVEWCGMWLCIETDGHTHS